MSSANGPSPELLRIEEQGPVRIITIDREHAGNSISIETAREFGTLFARFAQDDAVRAVVITGAGEKFFCAGGDVKAYRDLQGEEDARTMSRQVLLMLRAIEAHRCIVIAAINGYAIGGGCELSLSCDIRIAAKSARIGMPQVRLGVTPGWGAWRRLAQTVGRAKAIELLVTGKTLDANEAHAIGLVNAVAENEPVRDAAVRMAREIAQSPPAAVAANKRLIREAMDLPIDAGDDLAEEMFGALWVSDEHRQAEAAFSER